MTSFEQFLVGAGINLAVAILIVRFIYYPAAHQKSYVFLLLIFNIVIYFVMSMLTSIELSLGVGFGLFAIFTVLRYRTEEIPIREITYLFVTLALPVMNSTLAAGGDLPRLAVANVVTVAALFILERSWGFHFEATKHVTYERIELITPDRYDDLVADLRLRTGLDVTLVEVGEVNFLRDIAELTVHYHATAVEDPRRRESQLQAPRTATTRTETTN